MGRRVPVALAVQMTRYATSTDDPRANPATFAVTARSNRGIDVMIPVDSHDAALARARELRVFENHMVCVLHHGKRVARWDRVNAGGGRAYGQKPPKENRWRRVPIDRPELVGGVREIWTIYLRGEDEIRKYNASCRAVEIDRSAS